MDLGLAHSQVILEVCFALISHEMNANECIHFMSGQLTKIRN